MRIRPKIQSTVLLAAVFPLLACAFIVYFTARREILQRAHSQLAAFSDLQRDRADALIRQNLERLALVSSSTRLRVNLQRHLESGEAEPLEDLLRIITDARDSIPDFRHISIADTKGTIVVSTNAGRIGADVSGEAYFRKGIAGDSADTFAPGGEGGELTEYLCGPLVIEDRLIGVVVIEAAGSNLLALMKADPGLGATAETQLATSGPGGEPVFLTPLAGTPAIPARAEAMKLALAREERFLPNATDYRGRKVLAATRYIDCGALGLVIKVDRSEALAPIVRLRNLGALALLGTILVIVALSWGLSRSITSPLRNLTETADGIARGDYTRRARVDTRDEFGKLAHDFNEMAENLVELNRNLESQVEERTRDLKREIKASRNSQEALAKSEERFALAVRGSTDGIWDWDIETDEVYYSARFKELLGHADHEIENRFYEFESRLFPGDREATMAAVRAHLQEEVPYDVEYRLRCKDGSYRWFRARGEAVRDKAGRATRMAGSISDIADRKEAVAALEWSEERFRQLADNINGVFWIVSVDLEEMIYCSPPYETIFGWPISALYETPQNWIRRIHPEDRDAAVNEFRESVGSFDMEYRIIRPDGSIRWIHDRGFPVYNRAGSVYRVAGIAEDITAKKKAEQEMRRSNEELEQFAYVASHDLQEPLRMVKNYLQLLEKRCADRLDADAREFIAFAVDGAKRMQDLVRDLLAYSRVGARPVMFERIESEEAFATALQNLQVAIEESRAEITHDSLPPVRGDRTQIVQVFQNLIGNAIKFSGGKPPRVHVAALAEGSHWRFSVRDEGIGIEEKDLERIFLIFQRLHRREEYPGTGIGLAVCKKIVERHGGTITAESVPGAGTTLRFTLPAA